MIFWFSMGVLATLAAEFGLAHVFNMINKKEVAKADSVLAKIDNTVIKDKIGKWIDDEVKRAEIFMKLKESGTPVPSGNTESSQVTTAQ